ncbi:hypothetical protein [Aeromonas phage T7-Ah]|uniref:Uncharacterized protein n=1 Tax=Aeromonas phage T7-Ah TaxID=2759196 RepID=A0A7S6HS94_9CAUD|nr:hypothetical protein [Aeromonas phage T7-Ah]
MTDIQYHGKVYQAVNTGSQFTKTPNGNVLYKHPVTGPFKWVVSGWTPEEIDWAHKCGYLKVVSEK